MGLLNNIFSVTKYNNTHLLLKFLGIKLKFPKSQTKKVLKENPFYVYKKNNIDITTIPKATGQIRDIQLANLNLLKEFDFVCRNNNLSYWLDAGTAIGAIRHKGFIPWDDDIDVAMLRDDYNKIIEIFNKNTRNKDIFASSVELKNHQFLIKIQHKKCQHIFVDIFPFDFYGKSICVDEQIKITKKIKSLISKIKKSKEKLSLDDIKKLYQKEVLFNQKEVIIEENDLIWGLDYHHQWNNWFTNYNVIFPLKETEFEGYRFKSMNKPDLFLKRVYGNYMSYPKKIGVGHSSYALLTDEEKQIIEELKVVNNE